MIQLQTARQLISFNTVVRKCELLMARLTSEINDEVRFDIFVYRNRVEKGED